MNFVLFSLLITLCFTGTSPITSGKQETRVLTKNNWDYWLMTPSEQAPWTACGYKDDISQVQILVSVTESVISLFDKLNGYIKVGADPTSSDYDFKLIPDSNTYFYIWNYNLGEHGAITDELHIAVEADQVILVNWYFITVTLIIPQKLNHGQDLDLDIYLNYYRIFYLESNENIRDEPAHVYLNVDARHDVCNNMEMQICFFSQGLDDNPTVNVGFPASSGFTYSLCKAMIKGEWKGEIEASMYTCGSEESPSYQRAYALLVLRDEQWLCSNIQPISITMSINSVTIEEAEQHDCERDVDDPPPKTVDSPGGIMAFFQSKTGLYTSISVGTALCILLVYYVYQRGKFKGIEEREQEMSVFGSYYSGAKSWISSKAKSYWGGSGYGAGFSKYGASSTSSMGSDDGGGSLFSLGSLKKSKYGASSYYSGSSRSGSSSIGSSSMGASSLEFSSKKSKKSRLSWDGGSSYTSSDGTLVSSASALRKKSIPGSHKSKSSKKKNRTSSFDGGSRKSKSSRSRSRSRSSSGSRKSSSSIGSRSKKHKQKHRASSRSRSSSAKRH